MRTSLLFCIVFIEFFSTTRGQSVPSTPRFPILDLSRKLQSPMQCYPIRYDDVLGISYGPVNKTVGLKLRKFSGWWSGIPLWLLTAAEMRSSFKGNSFLSVDITRDATLKLRNIYLNPAVGYKRIAFNRGIRIEQFYAGMELEVDENRITFGYAEQKARTAEENGRRGFILQFYRELFYLTELKLTSAFLFDELQYAISVDRRLPSKDISFGIRYEKINDWSELVFSIMFGY